MKSLHTLRSTAMLLVMVTGTGTGIASTIAPLENAQAEATDIHDIFSPSIRQLASGCHCETGFMAFEQLMTICVENHEVTSAHSGCY